MLLSNNFTTFQQKFTDKLRLMLASNELGAFILVLANSMQDEVLREFLEDDLNHYFNHLKQQELQGSTDDIEVFSALLKTGIEDYNSWQIRDLLPWLCVYNPLRALRPPRASKKRITTLQQAFNPQGFHFNKPFLRPEILTEINFQQQNLRILYNKFPFVPYHLLIVLQPEQQQPQYLTLQAHTTIWNFVNQQASTLPHFGIAYNSLGAGASVNHLHFQGFIQKSFAIEDPQWSHNDGHKTYPLACIRIDSLTESWQQLTQYHQDNQAYNILYRAGYCYLIPRQSQGIVALPNWLPSFGWYEACGAFNFSNLALFSKVSEQNIKDSLSNQST